MLPPLVSVREAHRHMLETVQKLDQDAASQPSLLPGWTRAHVVAHLADNARALGRLAEAAVKGDLIDMYVGGMAQRDASIDALTALDAPDLVGELRRSSMALESIWTLVTADGWQARVRFRNGTLGDTVYCRWREAWIHVVDADVGLTPEAWPASLAVHTVDFLVGRLPAGWAIECLDTGTAIAARGASTRGVLRADVRAVAAWLAGRSFERLPVSSAGALPKLGPWPPAPDPLY